MKNTNMKQIINNLLIDINNNFNDFKEKIIRIDNHKKIINESIETIIFKSKKQQMEEEIKKSIKKEYTRGGYEIISLSSEDFMRIATQKYKLLKK